MLNIFVLRQRGVHDAFGSNSSTARPDKRFSYAFYSVIVYVGGRNQE